MKTYLLFILSALILISCGRNRRGGTENASIPVGESDFFVFDLEGGITQDPKATTINELIDSIFYISLETTKDALFPNPYKLAVIKGDMFISGGDITSSIFKFDSSGRFVSQMTRQGRGPGEVIAGRTWYANAGLEQISFVDILGHKMLLVSTQSGKAREIPIGSLSQSGFQTPLNDSTFVSNLTLIGADDHKAYLYFFDNSGEMIHSRERNDDKTEYKIVLREGDQWTGPHDNYWLTSDYKGDAIFHDIFNDTLYRIKSRHEITPHLVFRRGALSPHPEDAENTDKKKKQVYFNTLIESDNHVFLSYYYGGDKMWCDLWSKRDGSLLLHTTPQDPQNTRYAKMIYVPFALPDGEKVDLQVVFADKDKIYCVLEALDACKFLPGVNEDDNPVIVIAKLKK